MKQFLKERWLFLQALKKNPGAIGAAFPSSRFLAKAMVQQIPKGCTELIVELGAGTGAITDLLQKKFPHNQLIIIERSEKLVEVLRKKFPDITIILGDAINLVEIMQPFSQTVAVILSSLPLRSIPSTVVEKIQTAALNILPQHGRFIQFTYDPRNTAKEVLPKFKHLYHRKVWFNLPPAKVDVYQKC